MQNPTKSKDVFLVFSLQKLKGSNKMGSSKIVFDIKYYADGKTVEKMYKRLRKKLDAKSVGQQ